MIALCTRSDCITLIENGYYKDTISLYRYCIRSNSDTEEELLKGDVAQYFQYDNNFHSFYIFSKVNDSFELMEENNSVTDKFDQSFLQKLFLQSVQKSLAYDVSKISFYRKSDLAYLDALGFNDVALIPEKSVFNYVSTFLQQLKLTSVPPFNIKFIQQFSQNKVIIKEFKLTPCVYFPQITNFVQKELEELNQQVLDQLFDEQKMNIFTTNTKCFNPSLVFQGHEMNMITMQIDELNNDQLYQADKFKESFFLVQILQKYNKIPQNKQEAISMFEELINDPTYGREQIQQPINNIVVHQDELTEENAEFSEEQ